MIAWWLGVAAAQEEACSAPYLRAGFEGDLAVAEGFFARGLGARGQEAFELLRQRLRCVDGVPKPEAMARMEALGALAGHADQDTERALRWARAAEWVVPRPPWPVPPEHPLRVELLASEPVRIDSVGAAFALPKGGALWLSGRRMEAPLLPVDVPLLLQVTDGDGALVRTEWLDGAAFPPDLLAAAPAPKGKRPK
jgi:hypothetical protein